MIGRDRARQILKEHVGKDTLLQHCRETELIMHALAERLNRDVEAWSIAGLLHDIDFEATRDGPEAHGLKAEEILREHDLPVEVITAIKAHNGEMNGTPVGADIDWALRCAETITGLLIATALVRPDRKLDSVKVRSVKKKMKDKAFARNVSREIIRECEKLGLEVDEFIELALNALKPAAAEFGV